MAIESFWADEDFQDTLVALLCRDSETLRKIAHLLTPDDFKPIRGQRWGNQRWLIADRALTYWQKHHEPIGRMLRSDYLAYAESLGMGEQKVTALNAYQQRLESLELTAPDALVEKVTEYKITRLRVVALRELSELAADNQLTDESWNEVLSRVPTVSNGNGNHTIDYFETLPERLERRIAEGLIVHRPWSMIDPLDTLVDGLTYGELGLAIAPTGRGKSLFLLWIAVAYTFQRLNVLFVTLEDPRHTVEDRLDAMVTYIPVKKLRENPKLTTERFNRYRRFVSNRLHIYDGSGGGVSLAHIENVLEQERADGFFPDALIVDYDDELIAGARYKERRFELADVYRGLRQLIGRKYLIGWTASQTHGETKSRKILTEDNTAEDKGKVRKCTFAVGLGQGDDTWGKDSIFLWVSKHKNSNRHLGCHIVPDLERQLIYDKEATAKAAIANRKNNP